MVDAVPDLGSELASWPTSTTHTRTNPVPGKGSIVCRRTCHPIWRSPAFLHANHSGPRVATVSSSFPALVQNTSGPRRWRCALSAARTSSPRGISRCLPRLRRADVTSHDALPHRDPPCDQIDVLPTEADQLGAHVDGEFIVGFGMPWARRPLEFGDDGRGPWFEGGGVNVSR